MACLDSALLITTGSRTKLGSSQFEWGRPRWPRGSCSYPPHIAASTGGRRKDEERDDGHKRGPGVRELRDPIHGFISRHDPEDQIIDCKVFQRLRRLKQLALASLVYPGALHTRFEHFIGAMHVADRIAHAINLNEEDTRLVRLSALLHDIGHGPFSHVSEPILSSFRDTTRVKLKPNEQIHELLTRAIILNDHDLGYVLSKRELEHIAGILEGTYGDSVLKGIVSGPLDADKQDYLLRDSYFCGVKYGVFDLDRLLETLRINKDSTGERFLTISEAGTHALEQFVLAKYYLNTQVYSHKIRLITDSMIRRGIYLGIAVDSIDWLRELYQFDGSAGYIEKYVKWTDDRLFTTILADSTPSGWAKKYFEALSDRRLHKVVASYSISQFEDPLARRFFTNLDFSQLQSAEIQTLEAELAKVLGCDGHDVILSSYTIRSVREQSRNSESSILVQTADDVLVPFEEQSPLFRSIDEAVQVRFVEVYAPFECDDQTERRRRLGDLRKTIFKTLNDYSLTAVKSTAAPSAAE